MPKSLIDLPPPSPDAVRRLLALFAPHDTAESAPAATDAA